MYLYSALPIIFFSGGEYGFASSVALSTLTVLLPSIASNFSVSLVLMQIRAAVLPFALTVNA
ncbi:MAG: hypothetical protein IKK91_01385 [Ruminococcus sp.]|nr:hypothetical protein [Ruminococcus sp.]